MLDIINPRVAVNRSGIYEIRYSERGDGRTFSRYQSTGTADRLTAEAVLKDWLANRATLTVRDKSPRIREILDNYEKVLKARGKGETQLICIAHLRRVMGASRISDINSSFCLAYENERKVAGPTIRRELSTLTAAINQAVKDRRITLADKPIIDLPKSGQPRTEYLEPDEIDVFLQMAMDASDGAKRLTRLTRFVFIAIETGARKHAIEGLRWDKVDLERGTIDFRDGSNHKKRRVKTSISEVLLPVLKRAYEERNKDQKSPYVLDHGGSIRRTWETWIGGTPYANRITIHALRKSFASAALQAGVPVEVVADAIGDTVATTLRFYAFISHKQRAQAVNWRKAAAG